MFSLKRSMHVRFVPATSNLIQHNNLASRTFKQKLYPTCISYPNFVTESSHHTTPSVPRDCSINYFRSGNHLAQEQFDTMKCKKQTGIKENEEKATITTTQTDGRCACLTSSLPLTMHILTSSSGENHVSLCKQIKHK
jgi:hypothetical protein